DKPLQGTGAGTFELVDRVERDSPLATTEPHSVPLQFLSETGIVGFLLYAAVAAAAVMGILRRERARVWLALALGVALCFVHSWVDIDWDFIAVQGPLFLVVGALVSGGGPATPTRARRWLVSGPRCRGERRDCPQQTRSGLDRGPIRARVQSAVGGRALPGSALRAGREGAPALQARA